MDVNYSIHNYFNEFWLAKCSDANRIYFILALRWPGEYKWIGSANGER